jgi:hypothetical protein
MVLNLLLESDKIVDGEIEIQCSHGGWEKVFTVCG